MIGETILLFSIIWYLKALSARILTTVNNPEICSWLIEMWNYSDSVSNDSDANIKSLFISIDRSSK